MGKFHIDFLIFQSIEECCDNIRLLGLEVSDYRKSKQDLANSWLNHCCICLMIVHALDLLKAVDNPSGLVARHFPIESRFGLGPSVRSRPSDS